MKIESYKIKRVNREEVLMEEQEKCKNKKNVGVFEKKKNTLRIIIIVEGVHSNTKLNNQQQLAFIEDLPYAVY